MSEKGEFSYEYLSKYRNVLMGLQILLIIFFHFSVDNYYVRDSRIIHLFYKYIRSSGVDMFLLLSGMGLYFSWKSKPVKKAFYIKRYTRILIPYFIVAIPAWIWLDVFYNNGSWMNVIKDLFFISFFFDQTRWFWYILMMGICYWFFPYVFDMIDTADKNSQRMRVLLLCMASTLGITLLQLYYPELYSCVSIAVTRIPSFIVGVMIGKKVYEKQIIPRKQVYAMLLIAVALAWPLQMVTKKIVGVYSLAFLNYSLTLLFVLILLNMSKSGMKWLVKAHDLIVSVLSWFGKYTLELYLLHVLIRKVMSRYGYPTYRILYEGILVILSIILSIVVNRVSEYIRERACFRLNNLGD